jgi:hypothetical protein
MCLAIIYRGKQKKEALAKLPKSGYYWKMVLRRFNKDGYYPSVKNLPNDKPFKAGWNTTKLKYNNEGYALCFHLWREKSVNSGGIRCVIKKKDIVAIGKQWGNLCIVTKRFWMPKPKG